MNPYHKFNLHFDRGGSLNQTEIPPESLDLIIQFENFPDIQAIRLQNRKKLVESRQKLSRDLHIFRLGGEKNVNELKRKWNLPNRFLKEA